MKPLSQLVFSKENPKNIVITTHHKPDGDALGSSLGTMLYLRALGQNVTVVSPSDYPYFLNWLPFQNEVIVFPDNKQVATELLNNADYIFCLDFNKTERTQDMHEALDAAPGLKVMIDHHIGPDAFAAYGISNTKAVATCEMVYSWIEANGHKHLIDKDMATCLYTGIITDSGSFRFPATTPEVLIAAAHLMECGAVPSEIHENIFDNSTESRLKFLAFCLGEKLQIWYEHKTAAIFITKAELEKFKISTGDSEGIVNYALSIQGIRFAAFVVERADRVKMSFRSKGNFAANKYAEKYFSGGGHFNAAGGYSFEDIANVEQKFISLIPTISEFYV